MDPIDQYIPDAEPESDFANPFDDYWAQKPGDEIGDLILDRVNTFDNEIDANGMKNLWLKKYRYWYGRFLNDWNNEAAGLGRLGEHGEYIFLGVNHFRSIGKNIHSLAVQNPPVFDVRSVNTDTRGVQLASLGQNILEYYTRHKKVAKAMERAVEHALIFDAGYCLVEWDPMAGSEYGQYPDPDTGRVVNEGDLRVTTPLSFDVIFDPLKESFDLLDWVIVREWVPRVDLLAQYADQPELAEEIRNAEGKAKKFWDRSHWRLLNLSTEGQKLNDDVLILKMYHRKSEAMPEGRYVLALASGHVILDTFLPYPKIPLERLVADDQIGSPFGYSPLNNILALQDSINVLNSTILTNQYTHGVNIIAVQKGSDVNLNEFGRGINVMYYSQGAQVPQAISFTKTAGEIFTYKQDLERQMELLTGISDVTRGATRSGASGQGNALLAAISAQNQGAFQASYADLCSNVATLMLKILRDFANNPRTMAIAGKNNGKAFYEGSDLIDIEHVYVDLGNPLTRTQAGRLQMAQDLLRQGLIGPEDFFEVLSTGSLEAGYEKTRSEMDWVKTENEHLRQGTGITVHPLDNHDLHISYHKSLLQTEELRIPRTEEDLRILQIVQDHINQHDQAIARSQVMATPTPADPPQPGGGPGGVPLPQDGGPGGRPPGGAGDDVTASGAVSPVNPEVQDAANMGVDMPSPAQPPQM